MRTAGLCSALVAVFLAAASMSPAQNFIGQKAEKGGDMPKGVEHINRDPLRPDDWYQDYQFKWREKRIDSIDYGAIAGPEPVPFFHGETISRMAFSPDGSLLASGTYSGGIKVWKASTGETLAKLDGHRKWISALAFSADSKQLISGSGDSSIRLWDVKRGAEETRLAPLADTPLEIVVHPTNKEVYWCGSMTAVGAWNPETGAERFFSTRGQLTRSLALAVSKDRLAMAGERDGVEYWHFENDRNRGESFFNGARDGAIAFNNDGILVAAHTELRDQRLQLVVHTEQDRRQPKRVEPSDTSLVRVAMSADASVIAQCFENRCVLWSTSANEGSIQIPSAWAGGVALSADGNKIATCDDSGAVFIWSTATGRRVSPFPMQTWLRPLVHRIAKGDPVGIALHWGYPNQALHWPLREPTINATATLESMNFHLVDPDNMQHQLVIDQVVTKDRYAYSRPIYYSPTWVIQFDSEGLARANGLSGKWQSLRRPHFNRPGKFRFRMDGAIKMNGDSDIRFRSGEISWEVAEDGIASANRIIDAADRKLREFLPLQKSAALRVMAYGTRNNDGIASLIDDKDGNRLVRFFGPESSWSYSRYEVRCSPLGEVARIDQDEIHTCIAAGTRVSTPSGEIPVESVHEGMQLWGFDFEKRQRVPVEVVLCRRHPADRTIEIGDLRVTPEHPVYANGKWRAAGTLRGGERLVAPTGERIKAAAPRLIDEPVDVYELVVDGPHNYFAGGVVVHNKSRDYSPYLDDAWYQMFPQRRYKHRQVWPEEKDLSEEETEK